jgi:predicted DNA binding CopG/RHH family protein
MYDKEELEIVDYIEEENQKSVPNLSDKMDKIKSAVTVKYTKRKAINIKVLESDLEKLKSKALEEGMPYQILLNSVLHKYITGQLVDKGRIA